MGVGRIRVDPIEMEPGDLLITDGRMSLEVGDILLVVRRLQGHGKQHRSRQRTGEW